MKREKNHDQASARLSPDIDLVGDDGLACVCQPLPDHERHTRQRQAYRPIGKPVSLVAPILRRPLGQDGCLGGQTFDKGISGAVSAPLPPPSSSPRILPSPQPTCPLSEAKSCCAPRRHAGRAPSRAGSYTLDLVLSSSSQPHRVGKRARPRPRCHLETAAPWTVPRLGPLIRQLG